MIAIYLPFPPSANRLTRHGTRGGKLMSYSDPAYTSWKADAYCEYLRQKKTAGEPIKGFFSYHIALDKTRWPKASDGDNRGKAVLDFLQSVGLIENDKYAVGGTWSWAPVKGCFVQAHRVTESELARSDTSSGRKSKASLIAAG